MAFLTYVELKSPDLPRKAGQHIVATTERDTVSRPAHRRAAHRHRAAPARLASRASGRTNRGVTMMTSSFSSLRTFMFLKNAPMIGISPSKGDLVHTGERALADQAANDETFTIAQFHRGVGTPGQQCRHGAATDIDGIGDSPGRWPAVPLSAQIRLGPNTVGVTARPIPKALYSIADAAQTLWNRNGDFARQPESLRCDQTEPPTWVRPECAPCRCFAAGASWRWWCCSHSPEC